MKKLTCVLLVVGLWGCTEENPAFNPDPLLPGECRAGLEVSETFESFERPEQLDLLFVVDNSGSVADQQSALARALPGMLNGLKSDGLSVRVGVMTTDATVAPGLAPAGNSAEGCESNTTQIAHTEQANWTQIAACNIQQGSGGDAYQRSLEVVERALLEEDSSFRRERARLVIIIVSNEDDCSSVGPIVGDEDAAARNRCVWHRDGLSSVEAWANDLMRTTQSAEGISLAVITGPPSALQYSSGQDVRTVCQSAFGGAYPANRLYDAVGYFGDRGHFASICVEGFGHHLTQIADRLARPTTVTLCPSRPLAHEPLSMVVRKGDGETSHVPLGSHGFMFLGRTSDCNNGLLRFEQSTLRGAQSLKTEYCVIP